MQNDGLNCCNKKQLTEMEIPVKSIIISLLLTFHTSWCWWSFTGSEWQQVSSGIQYSPQYSGQSQQSYGLYSLDSIFDFQFFSFFPRPWGPFQVHQFQVVSLILSCATAFSALWQDPSISLPFCFLSFSLCGLLEW